MFMRKKRCMNPYLTIIVCTMAAIGVVSLVDKGKTMCMEKMECLKEKMPVMFSHKENE